MIGKCIGVNSFKQINLNKENECITLFERLIIDLSTCYFSMFIMRIAG